MPGNIGTSEVLIIAVIILVFFGKNKLNDLARGLGESTKEYNKLKKEFNNALNQDLNILGDDEPSPDTKEEKEENIKTVIKTGLETKKEDKQEAEA